MEREQRNQDAIEEERAALMKLKEVSRHTKKTSPQTFIFSHFPPTSPLSLPPQEKNNEILGYNNEVGIVTKLIRELMIVAHFLF